MGRETLFSHIVFQPLPQRISFSPFQRIVDTIDFYFLTSYSIFLLPCSRRTLNDTMIARNYKVKKGETQRCILLSP